jgi:hypothetical protein
VTPTPKSPAQLEEETLDTLKILFYVYSVFVALSTLLVAVILAAFVLGFGFAAREHGNPRHVAVGMGVFSLIFSIAFLILAVKTVAVFLAGRFTGERTHHTFIFVVAFLCMINIPLGTALGIFALLTLNKDSVKRRFGA